MKPKKQRAADTSKQSSYDICQTPPHALEPLYPMLDMWYRYKQDNLKGKLTIWESACGPECLIGQEFLKRSYKVIATDIIYGYNYFDYEPEFEYDLEMTNVPFSLKYLWIRLACKRGKPFIFIVPSDIITAGEFDQITKEYGKRNFVILQPNRRINYKRNDTGWGVKVWDEAKQRFVWRGRQAQMSTSFLCYKIDNDLFEPYWENSPAIEVYHVPMRNVKYDENNKEIT